MKVCGFTFVRNAIKFGYPVIESINSILPICDKLIVAVGNSDDGTLNLIQSINNPKIQIIETIWDDSLREGGKVLAIETDKAFDAIKSEYDWCFYIQADEVLHEKYHQVIVESMQQFLSNKNVEGLLFDYAHFYGSFRYLACSRNWYRKEIRIIRNDKAIRSYKDAQGFRKNGEKLNVKQIDASIYHYGWVRPPSIMQDKVKNFHQLWHSDEWIKSNTTDSHLFDYSNVDMIKLFEGVHPKVMKERIDNMDWAVELDLKKKNISFKGRLLFGFEKITGKRLFEHKNFRVI